MERKRLSFTLMPEYGGYSVEFAGRKITTGNRTAYYYNSENVKIDFLQAVSVEEKPYNTGFGEGMKVCYTFSEGVVIETWIFMEDVNKCLHFYINVTNGGEKISKLVWPPSAKMDNSGIGYTVLPIMQGILLHDSYEKEVDTFLEGRFSSRAATMNWWGQVNDGAGYMALVENYWDAGYEYRHEPGMPTDVNVYWLPSLGDMSGYTRKMCVYFFEECNYVTFCKEYRKYIKEIGKFVSLEEKMIKNPAVRRLIGSTVLNTPMVYWHAEPESPYYNKEIPERNNSYYSFDKVGEQLHRLKKHGLENAYLHIDGWQRAGYDNQHPDTLPPAEGAGGIDGYKRLLETCKELDYVFAIHDQYHDYYDRAPSFDVDQAAYDADGTMRRCCDWPGGSAAFLCMSLARYYLERNFTEMERMGILPEGAYLDCFSIVPPEECAHKDHLMTREKSIEYRKGCFGYVRSKGLIVSSEEGTCSFMSDLDLLHHSPYYQEIIELLGMESFGQCVPLLSLVYHDALFVPWGLGKGEWGIPRGESGLLHCLLNGGIGTTTISLGEKDVWRAQTVSSFNQKVWNKEMISHRFLSADGKQQESEFAGGYRVQVDYAKDMVRIIYPDGSIQDIAENNGI